MSENVFDKAKISDEEWSRLQISRLSSRPNAKTAYGSGGYDAKAMKEAFDAQGNMLKDRHNKLTEYAKEEENARSEAEAERTQKESERLNAETERTQKELERLDAEEEREKKEIDRLAAEEARLIAEGSADPKSEYYGGRALAEKERSSLGLIVKNGRVCLKFDN